MKRIVMILRALSLLCVLLGMPEATHSTSWETVVVPAKISDFPIGLRVQARGLESGSVGFAVSVAKDHDASSRGELQIDEWAPSDPPANRTTPDGKTVRTLQARSWRMSCFVRGEVRDEILEYRFTIPREWLEEAHFEYSNNLVQSADRYRVRLKDFAPPDEQ